MNKPHLRQTALLRSMLCICSSVAVAHVSAGGILETNTLSTIYVAAQNDQDKNDQFGVATTAAQGVITQEQLQTRPLLPPAEVLETVPGLIVTQHSGDGKANQYFLRGFNLDHGTDFATFVAGIPVNMVSHAHGQGYTDLNFLIPELVESISYHKGATQMADGDFASAGSAHINLVSRIEQPFIQLSAGSDAYKRLLGAGSWQWAGGTLLGAVELMANDGPWQIPENLKKQNLLLRYSHGDHANGWSVLASHYQSDWDSTDQIAERAINQGLVARYGSLNASDGGKARRDALSFEKNISNDHQRTHINAYAVDSMLNLFSDFSYFLNDPVRGDQFEQSEKRQIIGAKINQDWLTHWHNRAVVNSMGSSIRYDHISGLGLYQTEQRQRFATIREDKVKETALAIWAQNQLQWNPWFKSIASLRADYYNFDVNSSLVANSGQQHDHIVSPKLNLVFGPWRNTEYYAGYGYGFHSNDARGTTIRINPDPRDPGYLQPVDSVSALVRTKNIELGIRTEWFKNLHGTLSLWQMDSDSELVFVGDAGTTEASRPSRRQGIEISHYYKPSQQLIIDVDAAWSKARFKDNAPEGQYIPGAIEKTASAGISYKPNHAWSTGLRLRYFGPRPLLEDNSEKSSSSTLVNLQATYHINPHWQAQLDVLNLFNRKVNDIEYLYQSCLNQEAALPECNASASTREGVVDRHVHPAEPRALRLSVRYTF